MVCCGLFLFGEKVFACCFFFAFVVLSYCFLAAGLLFVVVVPNHVTMGCSNVLSTS